MTAAAAFWRHTGRLEGRGAFGDQRHLMQRGRSDGVGNRYALMAERGELETFPGHATPGGCLCHVPRLKTLLGE